MMRVEFRRSRVKTMKNALVSVVVLLAMAIPAMAQPQSQLRAGNNPSTASLPSQIDVDTYKLDITVDPEARKVEAKADIVLKVLERNAVSTFDLDKHFKVTKVTVGDVSPRYRQFEYDSTLEVDLGNSATAVDGTLTLHVEYYGLFDTANDLRNPILDYLSKDSAYFLYEGKWFPTNGLYKDKAAMQLAVHAPAGWTVVTDLPASGSGFASWASSSATRVSISASPRGVTRFGPGGTGSSNFGSRCSSSLSRRKATLIGSTVPGSCPPR